MLKTPKTYVYTDTKDHSREYRDVRMTNQPGQVIIDWKTHDDKSDKESSIEINDKETELYLFIDGLKITGANTSDSIYNDGSRLGKRLQSSSYQLNLSLYMNVTYRSQFLKDTVMTWKKKKIDCLVVESEAVAVFGNRQDHSFRKEVKSKNIYYFGKGVGLMKFSEQSANKYSNHELKEINELK
jgi:hypothetical protein